MGLAPLTIALKRSSECASPHIVGIALHAKGAICWHKMYTNGECGAQHFAHIAFYTSGECGAKHFVGIAL